MLWLLWVGELKTTFHTGWSKTLGVLAMAIRDISKLKEVGNYLVVCILVMCNEPNWLIIWIIVGTCKTSKDCAWVQCSKDGQAVPVPAPPPLPAQKTCDMKSMFAYYGMHPFSGGIQLMVSKNGNDKKNYSFSLLFQIFIMLLNLFIGKEYVSQVSCKNSVCKAQDKKITDACKYICGANKC